MTHKQFRITSETFRLPGDDPTIPDAYVDPKDLADLKKLAGIDSLNLMQVPCTATAEEYQENVLDKGKYQRENNIKPGTDEWFRLWFARKGLTGESPTK
jgi:hypothetical protein